MLRYFYNTLLCLLFPIIPLRLWWRGRKNSAYNERWSERFAIYKNSALTSSIWIHAVSLGESIAAIPLIQALKKTYPKENIIVTTMTPTGSHKMRTTFGDAILHFYLPYDYPIMVKRFLDHFNPRLLVIMETELWPNVLHYTNVRKIPIILANARLSLHSFRRYSYVKPLSKKMLNLITLVAAQSVDDGIRFLQLGLAKQRLTVTGNIKFDIAIPRNTQTEANNIMRNWRLNPKRPIWIAASTHEGEEEIILATAKKVLRILPKAVLILAPRHPERFDKVFDLCRKRGFNIVRFSHNPICSMQTQIILADTIGKLLQFYALAKVAFIGGSLVAIGGHNLLEPAALGVPILTGPHLTNFLEISKLLFQAKAAQLVNDENELAEWVIKLLHEEKLNLKMTKAAREVIAQNRGALKQILNFISQNV